MASSFLAELDRLAQEEALSHFDRYFARTLARLDPDGDPEVLLGAVLARRAVDAGHICLDLTTATGIDSPTGEAGLPPPDRRAWQARLAVSPLVGDGSQPSPLVLDGNRLYLYRYWQYERQLAHAILAKAAAEPPAEDAVQGNKHLGRLLQGGRFAASQGQRQAILMALSRRLTVISGGPGTGKTTIVMYLLTVLQEMARAAGHDFLRVLLLAPTGKAAGRLAQSVQEKLAALPVTEDVRAALPNEALTIHRALGHQRRTPTTFRHNRQNPLLADVVVVDEASMVDAALMAKLFAAIPGQARLVLLGDKDQLASVEAGSLMGDICLAAAVGTPLNRSVIELQESFRFAPDRAIGALVRQIKQGDIEALSATLSGESAEVRHYPAASFTMTNEALRQAILGGFMPYLAAGEVGEALARLNGFRLLCAHRRGAAGIESLNRLCTKVLAGAGLLQPADPWYHGQPILIVANSYSLRLFNGDLGMIWSSPEDGSLRAYFLEPATGGLRAILPAKLPRHETAFAMTVHKSQGSEFDRVAVVLPPAMSPVLTRELLYTAVSRAKQAVALFGPLAVLLEAVGHRVQRASGLRERLARGV